MWSRGSGRERRVWEIGQVEVFTAPECRHTSNYVLIRVLTECVCFMHSHGRQRCLELTMFLTSEDLGTRD